MSQVDARLLVALKGADLTAQTAFMTLRDKMGLEKRVAGVKRFDLFDLSVDAGQEGPDTVAVLKRALDSQSTFYNRNKHVYGLFCRWEGGGSHEEGLSHDALRSRWTRELANYLHKSGNGNLDGKERAEPVILDGPCIYLVEVMVEDDDPSPKQSVAGRVARDVERFSGAAARVTCHHRATLWWLAIASSDAGEARQMAEQIAVTTRRDVGLLLNPNYQHAEFVSIEEMVPESS